MSGMSRGVPVTPLLPPPKIRFNSATHNFPNPLGGSSLAHDNMGKGLELQKCPFPGSSRGQRALGLFGIAADAVTVHAA